MRLMARMPRLLQPSVMVIAHLCPVFAVVASICSTVLGHLGDEGSTTAVLRVPRWLIVAIGAVHADSLCQQRGCPRGSYDRSPEHARTTRSAHG